MEKTITGKRPDLEALEVNAPESYIGNLIYPTVSVAEKTGNVYYKTVTADAVGQTGRVSGVAPTTTLLADSFVDFSCAEVIQRYGVDKNEVKQMGGIEAADRLGGMAAKRSVMRAIESAIAAQLFTGSAVNISAGIIDGLEDGAKAVKRFAGKLALVCSAAVYRHIVKQAEITGKLEFTFNVGGLDPADTLSGKAKLFLAMLQNIYGFEQVLIGDDDQWQPTGKADFAAIVKLPPAEAFSHKLDPVLGKTMVYMPDGVQPFEIETHYNEHLKVNQYDCSSWYAVRELNAGAKYLVNGLFPS